MAARSHQPEADIVRSKHYLSICSWNCSVASFVACAHSELDLGAIMYDRKVHAMRCQWITEK